MTRTSLLRLIIFALMLPWAWVAYTQHPRAQIQKVKGDLYLLSGEGGNVAVYVASEGVILVDDMYDRNHADILGQIRSVTDKPVRYLFNTHQHDDHAGDLFLPPLFGPPPEGAGRSRPFSACVFADHAQGGSFLDWTKTLDGVLTLKFDTVIPGHGPVSTRADVIKFRANLEAMRIRMEAR